MPKLIWEKKLQEFNFINKVFSFSKLKLPVKLFSLLLISSLITCFSGWIIMHEPDRAKTEFLQYTLLLYGAGFFLFIGL